MRNQTERVSTGLPTPTDRPSHAEPGFVPFNWVYTTGLAVGGRRAGRPPACWANFDAVLNMTLEEYAEATHPDNPPKGKHYLHLPVAEGKKDRRGLEQQMPHALTFAWPLLLAGKTLLVHCNQGKDRSVAVAIAILATFYSATMQLLPERVVTGSAAEAVAPGGGDCHDSTAGVPEWTSQRLLEHVARQRVDKQALQRCHQHVMQARPHASPTRHTLKKLNRFFMSHTTAAAAEAGTIALQG